jgi:hypothetical protein
MARLLKNNRAANRVLRIRMKFYEHCDTVVALLLYLLAYWKDG